MKGALKFLATSLAVAVMTAATVTPVSAATTGYTDETSVRGSSNFTSEWEKTTTYKVNNGTVTVGTMIYGYDKDYINEDYVWTKDTECYSRAKLYRDGHDKNSIYCAGSQKGKNTYSKIEVTHQTYYVSYKIELSSSYSGVTSTTASSSVK